MTPAPALTPCTAADLPRLTALLSAEGLPASDLDPGLAGFLAVRDGSGRLVAAGGLQRAGDVALLRSLVVDPGWRGRGLGRLLAEALIDEARERGIDQLWLLTTTAAAFFLALGFEPADRAGAPPAVRDTAEFRSLCPSSAACLRVELGMPPD